MSTATERKAMTKSELTGEIAAVCGLARGKAADALEALATAAARELGRKGPGQIVIPGLVRLKVVRKPATKARQGLNPFTQQMQTFKAKPARNVVKATAAKALRDKV